MATARLRGRWPSQIATSLRSSRWRKRLCSSRWRMFRHCERRHFRHCERSVAISDRHVASLLAMTHVSSLRPRACVAGGNFRSPRRFAPRDDGRGFAPRDDACSVIASVDIFVMASLNISVIATASLRGGWQSQIATSLRSSRW